MNPTLAQAIADAQSKLDPVDARALMRHALGVDDVFLAAHPEFGLSAAQKRHFDALVARRAAGEPVAYITGLREFFSLEFEVTPAVLIPRPETEVLVEITLEHLAPDGTCRVLELGTGSGCVAIAIARRRPRARVVAVDASAAALEVARGNARRHAVANVEFVHGDWFDAIGGARFDMIVANPPYVAQGDPHLDTGDLRFEPRAALVAGADGLDCIRLIIAQSPRYLEDAGWLAFEHGHDQAAQCRELLVAAGFGTLFARRDIAGIERVTGGQILRVR